MLDKDQPIMITLGIIDDGIYIYIYKRSYEYQLCLVYGSFYEQTVSLPEGAQKKGTQQEQIMIF